MLKRIERLDESISNKIAAGEVVERPSSVVKEMVENSIDANATNITIEIKNSGKSVIRVSDNGLGIYKDDIRLAFERHATSKIKNDIDIYNIKSLGFRGEALASIASVSNVELITKIENEKSGNKAIVRSGILKELTEIGCPQGTTIIVKDLFFNTPARYKFLKSNAAETNSINWVVNNLALSHPDISFRYIIDNKTIFTTPGNNDIQNTILTIYGKDIVKNLIRVQCYKENIDLKGYISDINYTRGNRQLQAVFVNGRYVESQELTESINAAYKTLLTVNRYPICFLYINIPTNKIDINIHPAKTKIRFNEEGHIKSFIYSSLRETLLKTNLVPDTGLENSNSSNFTNQEYKNVNMKERLEVEQKTKLSSNQNFQNQADTYSGIQENESYNKEDSNEKEQINIFIKEVLNNLNTDNYKDDYLKEKKEENIKDLIKSFRIVGQLFDTYIICEKDDQMYLIDQHAAHEKVLYEKYIQSYSHNEIISQILLEPIIIEKNYSDKKIILDSIGILNRLGYKVEDFGYNTIIIREIPIDFNINIAKIFFENIIEKYIHNKHGDIIMTDIVQMACKNAIKAKNTLDNIEIKALLNDLSTLENPFTCPHGRPVIISISKYELEKKFKRT